MESTLNGEKRIKTGYITVIMAQHEKDKVLYFDPKYGLD